MRMSWDDLQTIEALVRTGSLLAAATELSLRHSSVSRRVGAIERALEAPLLLRGARLKPTRLAESIAALAGLMADRARDIEGLVRSEQRLRERRLIVTTTDVLAPLLLDALAACALDRRVQLIVSDSVSELEPGVTDLAIRPSSQPGPALRGSRLGKLRIGIYRARQLRAGGSAWVLASPKLRDRASLRWLRATPGDAEGRIECDSLLAMRDACLAGLGKAVLPACVADKDPRLICEAEVAGGTPVWLLSAATRRSEPGLQAVARALAAELRRLPGIWASPS